MNIKNTSHQQQFGKSGGSVLCMTVFRKFEICCFKLSSVLESSPSKSGKLFVFISKKTSTLD
jgi:hypothetical protein